MHLRSTPHMRDTWRERHCMETFRNMRLLFLTWLRMGIPRDNPESGDSTVGFWQPYQEPLAHSQEREYLVKDRGCSGSPVMTLLPQPPHEYTCRHFHSHLAISMVQKGKSQLLALQNTDAGLLLA